jgi:hypothetical protein
VENFNISVKLYNLPVTISKHQKISSLNSTHTIKNERKVNKQHIVKIQKASSFNLLSDVIKLLFYYTKWEENLKQKSVDSVKRVVGGTQLFNAFSTHTKKISIFSCFEMHILFSD